MTDFDRLQAWTFALFTQLRAAGINLPPPECINWSEITKASPEDIMQSAKTIASIASDHRTIH